MSAARAPEPAPRDGRAAARPARFRRRTNDALTALVFAGSEGRTAPPTPAELAPRPAPQLRRALRLRAVEARRAGGDPLALGALSLAALLQARWLSSAELTELYLARIARLNGDGSAITVGRGPGGADRRHAVYAGNGALNAFVSVYADRARDEARAADARLDAAARTGGWAPLLCGLPIALKDVIAVDELPLSLGCPPLHGRRVAGDSVIWSRLAAAGAVLLGHTHTGPWTADDLCPQTANPWRPELAIGGSSGGSACAVAARLAPLAVGTDTGNSLRNPAQQAGISTLKPSHGLIPLTGVSPLSPGLDHAGPMARSMEDVSLLLGALAGADPTDPESWRAPAAPTFPLLAGAGDRPLAGVRIGSTVAAEPDPDPSAWEPEIVAALHRCEEELRALGAEIVPVAPAERVHAASHETLVAEERRRVLAAAYAREDDPALAAAVKLRHRAAPQELDAPFGAGCAARELDAARRDRRAYRAAWAGVMAAQRLDAVLWPQKVQFPTRREDDFTEKFAGVDQARANVLGWPCAHLPLGVGPSGLPAGVDLAAPWGRDAEVLRIALAYQARYPHQLAAPTP